MSERVVWGLDIGQTGLRAIKLEKGKGGVVTIADTFFASIDSQPDDPQHEDKVRDAMQEFAAVKKVGSTPVVLSLPGYTTLFRSFPVPSVAPSKLREVVSYEAKQLVPYPLEEVQWDFEELGYNEDTDEIQIALLCCRSDIINNILEIADEAHLLIEDIQVGSVAMINFNIFDTPSDGTAMLLDCGARSTDFVMFNQESFWLRPIAICGDDVSRSLMKKFNISFEEAEQLKSSMNDEKQASRVFNVCEPVIRNLAAEAQRSFGFYRSTKRGASVDELILAGNTFLMEGADQYMADTLGYGARTMDLPQNLLLSPLVDAQELLECRQIYGIAAGLALQGLGLSRFTCSLLPEQRRFRKVLKKKEKYGWAAVGVIAVSTLLGMGLVKSNKPRFERDLREIDKIMAQANKRKSEYDNKMKQFEPQLKKNRKLLEVDKSRGWIAVASMDLYNQIDILNDERSKEVNRLPIHNKPQDQIIKNLLSNIQSWPESKNAYEKLLREKSLEFKVSEQTDADVKADMTKNLQMQVLRRISMMHNRLKQTFITSFDAYVTKGTKTKQGVDLVWKVEELSKDGKKSGGSPADFSFQPTAAPGGRNQRGNTNAPAKAPEAPKSEDVLLITINGFTVTQDGDDMRILRDRLGSLNVLGLYLYDTEGMPGGFKIIRDSETDKANTINLPVIYDPTPKKANLDEAGENGTLDRTEEITYEAYAKERISKFSAKLVYENVSPEIPADELEQMVAKIMTAREGEKKPAEDAAASAAPKAPEGEKAKEKAPEAKPAEVNKKK